MQLCIPRIETIYTREYIFSIVRKLKWGEIAKLLESIPKNNTDYRCVMIDIEWDDTNGNTDLKNRLLKGQYINIVHDETTPQFWRIMESNRPYKL